MTAKQLARKFITGTSTRLGAEFERSIKEIYFIDCIEKISKQMYEDLKDSDLDLDCKAMDVVLYKIGKRLKK